MHRVTMGQNSGVPSIVYIRLFRTCNVSCEVCDFSKERELPSIDPGALCNGLRRLAESGVSEVRFTGGEPLLYPDLENAIAVLSEQGVHTKLMTNGLLLRPERAATLVNSGLNSLRCITRQPKPTGT